ncbi:hypothetical protein ABZ379_10485 [Streptomyces canus]|uniref:hypothetical protein n=1 Tax=Streptomyces canus TaxID=58343 RepID=UPI0033CA0319
MARRPYRLSEDGRARLAANARKGLAVANSLDSQITRLERRADELTPELRARLSVLGQPQTGDRS